MKFSNRILSVFLLHFFLQSLLRKDISHYRSLKWSLLIIFNFTFYTQKKYFDRRAKKSQCEACCFTFVIDKEYIKKKASAMTLLTT